VPSPGQQYLFLPHTVQYAQLVLNKYATGPGESPADRSVFSHQYAVMRDMRRRTSVQEFFVWSPIMQEWLLQQKSTQARGNSLIYTLKSSSVPTQILMITCPKQFVNGIILHLEGSPPFELHSPELYFRLFREEKFLQRERVFRNHSQANPRGSMRDEMPAPSVIPVPSVRASSTPSLYARSVGAESSVAGDEAEEDAPASPFFEDLDECITIYTVNAKKDIKIQLMNCIITRHEIVYDGVTSSSYVLLKRMIDPTKPTDYTLPLLCTSIPDDARTISAWLSVPTANVKDGSALRNIMCNHLLNAELGLKIDYTCHFKVWQALLEHKPATSVQAVTGFGYSCGEDKIMYANVAVIPCPGGEWEAVSHLSLKMRFNPVGMSRSLALGVDRMPRPLIIPKHNIPHIANMFFSSLVPHCLKNNWVPAALGIVHIAVMGRHFHRIQDHRQAGRHVGHAPSLRRVRHGQVGDNPLCRAAPRARDDG
jgi:hypothetical protein